MISRGRKLQELLQLVEEQNFFGRVSLLQEQRCMDGTIRQDGREERYRVLGASTVGKVAMVKVGTHGCKARRRSPAEAARFAGVHSKKEGEVAAAVL